MESIKNKFGEAIKQVHEFGKVLKQTKRIEKENVVSGPLGTLEEMEAMGIETHGIMDDPGNPFLRDRFPGSKDWDLEGKIRCQQEKCIANKNGWCICPSLLAIDKNGKCAGYQPRKKKGKK